MDAVTTAAARPLVIEADIAAKSAFQKTLGSKGSFPEEPFFLLSKLVRVVELS